jgi:hypothetical protein
MYYSDKIDTIRSDIDRTKDLDLAKCKKALEEVLYIRRQTKDLLTDQ